MRNIYFLLISLFIYNLGFGQTIIYTQDFETLNTGYTASATVGSGFTDVFNRTTANVGGNSTYVWAVEDTDSTPATITLDQINVAGYSDFTFSIDMIAHHYNDWDNSDTFSVTYSLDGGTTQNLLWVRNAGGTFNQLPSLDTDFDGIGDCGAGTLPALTTGNSGCSTSDDTFSTFSSATIPLSSNSTLDIELSFEGLTANDEGIYLDNIEVVATSGGGGSCAISDIGITNAGSCNDNGTVSDPSDDYYLADIEVTFSNPPASGTIDLTGAGVVGGTTSVAVGTSVQTISGVQLKADGNDVEIIATFSDDTACTFTETVAGSGLASCSSGGGGSSNCATQVDFETQGNGYTTSITELTDGSGDYFTQTDGSNINGSFTGADGSFFAAQDIDGDQPTLPVELEITNINISNLTNLEFSIDLAEDDDGSNEDWDTGDYVRIFYSIDGGAEQNLIWIQNDGSTFNSVPSIDTDFDGVGDGTEITDTFSTFTESVTDTGSSMDIRIEFNLDGGDEDIAIDNIEVCGILASTNDSDSDIVTTSFDPTDNIDYSTYSASSGLTTSNAIKVGEFEIRDGGTTTDADNVGSILTDLDLDIANFDNLAAIALFDGNTNVSEVTNVSATTSFSSINSGNGITTADDGTKVFAVYATFNSNVTDNEQLDFSVSNATADGTNGSIFSSTDAGGASTPTTGDDNRIEVTATDLMFNQNPSDVEVSIVMSPSPTVLAIDSNDNTDLDYNTSFALSVSSSNFDASATISVNATNGVATFSNLIFNATSTGSTLTASSGSLTDDTSSSFDVTSAPIFPTPGDVFITEVSDAGDFNNEFLEIHNTSANAIDLSTTKLVMLPDDTVWDLSDFILSPIPSNGFAIISRGNPIADFETEFGTLNANTVFIEGSGGMFFGTGRRWQIFEGGTTDTADGVLLDDTEVGVADGDRDFQNIFDEEFVNTADNLANPGELDYLLYNNGTWVNNEVADATTSSEDVYFFDDFTASSNIALNDGGIKSPHILDLDTNNLTINGTFIFKSDTNGSAQLDDATGVSISGDVTVERFIPAFDNNVNGTNQGRAFRFLTSTVTTSSSINANWQEGATSNIDDPNSGFGTHITGSTTGANGFDATQTGNPSMFTFNNASTGTGAQDWAAISGTDGSNTLKAGRAYLALIRGDRSVDVTDNNTPPTNTTLRATGSLRTGNVDYALAIDALATDDSDFSLVANPYQAVVDYDMVTRSGLLDFIYVWDASFNSRGGYKTIDLNDQSNNIPSTANGSNFLAPGQSFFVENDSDNTTNTSITFKEGDKATDQAQVSVFSTNTFFKIQSGLFKTENLQSSSDISDGLLLLFDNNYTTLADDEDASKFTNPDENYAIINNGLRSIDKQAMPAIGHEIDLSITNYRDNNYSLTFDMENKPEDIGVFLNDAYLNTQAELTDDFVYNFSVDENIPESVASNRFSLSFDNSTLGLDENVFGDGFSLYPNPTQDGRFSIKTPNLSGEVNIEITNLLGQQISVQKLSVENQQVNVNAKNLSTGVYIVELHQNKNSFFSKLIVN